MGRVGGRLCRLSPFYPFAGLSREVEVLRLVAAGLTNQQIVAQLVISLSMVKSYLHNISGKLGTENRTQMAARARDMKLI